MRSREGDRRRVNGLLLAGATALVSGVSVFVSSYGVHDFSSPALYTTAKNLVAALVLFAGSILVIALRPDRSRPIRGGRSPGRGRRAQILRLMGFGYVGVVGGGVAFILFFDGLARTSAAPAAFLHDTLVVFVALLAWPVLSERVSAFNLAAIGLLIMGEVAIAHGIGPVALSSGTFLVLGATVLWAVETVTVKRLVGSTSAGQLALVRMGIGSLVLVGYLAGTGRLGDLGSLDAAQLGWALITGVLLAAYVASWFCALARARALDVTSILVGSVAVTSLLQGIAGRSLPRPGYLGVVLVALGIAALAGARPWRVVT